MQLFLSTTSPFARKVHLALIEKGLIEQVTLRLANPFEDNATLSLTTPLNRVPCLITQEGQCLADSHLICEFIDTLHNQPPLIPAQSKARWQTLNHAALSDGVIEATFRLVMERKRPASEQSHMWMQRWQAAIENTLSKLETPGAPDTNNVDIYQITLACALGYADFRLPEYDWRSPCPQLASWFENFSQRPSMVQSDPRR